MPKAKRTPKKPVKTKPDELDSDDQRRMDWEVNHESISTAFYDAVLKKKKMPTYTDLARITNLSLKTIQRHFEDPEILNQSRSKVRALRDKALLTVAIKAISGSNVQWARLFLETTEAEFVTKKVDVKSDGKALAKSVGPQLSNAQFAKLLTAINGKV